MFNPPLNRAPKLAFLWRAYIPRWRQIWPLKTILCISPLTGQLQRQILGVDLDKFKVGESIKKHTTFSRKMLVILLQFVVCSLAIYRWKELFKRKRMPMYAYS